MSPPCHSPAKRGACRHHHWADHQRRHEPTRETPDDVRTAYGYQEHRERGHRTSGSSWEASTIRSKPARAARWDTAEALMPSAMANSFFDRPSRRPSRSRKDRSSSDPSRWSRQIRAALIGRGVGAGVAWHCGRWCAPGPGPAVVGPTRSTRWPPARPTSPGRPGCRCRCPASVTGAPSDAEPDVNVWRQRQTQRQRCVDGGADGQIAALELVTDRQGRSVDRGGARPCRGLRSMCDAGGDGPGTPRSDDVTDQRRDRR